LPGRRAVSLPTNIPTAHEGIVVQHIGGTCPAWLELQNEVLKATDEDIRLAFTFVAADDLFVAVHEFISQQPDHRVFFFDALFELRDIARRLPYVCRDLSRQTLSPPTH
jgi:hypothetical protein